MKEDHPDLYPPDIPEGQTPRNPFDVVRQWPWDHPLHDPHAPESDGGGNTHVRHTPASGAGGMGIPTDHFHPFKMERFTRQKVDERGEPIRGKYEKVLRVYWGSLYFSICNVLTEKHVVLKLAHGGGGNNEEDVQEGEFGITGQSKIPGIGVKTPGEFSNGDGGTYPYREWVESVGEGEEAQEIVGAVRLGFWVNSDDYNVTKVFLVFTPDGEHAPADDPCGELKEVIDDQDTEGGNPKQLLREDPHTGKYFVLIGRSLPDAEQQERARGDDKQGNPLGQQQEQDRQEVNVLEDHHRARGVDVDALDEEGLAELPIPSSLVDQIIFDHIYYAVTIVAPSSATTMPGYSSGVPPTQDMYYKGPDPTDPPSRFPFFMHKLTPGDPPTYTGSLVDELEDEGNEYGGTGAAGGSGVPMGVMYPNTTEGSSYASGYEDVPSEGSGGSSGSGSY